MTQQMSIATSNGLLTLKIDTSRQLECPIYWPFTEVHASSERDADDLHRYTSPGYAGSTHFLGDEGFVFDPVQLILSGVFLYVPEDRFDGRNSLEAWLQTEEIKGLPVLSANGKFSVESPSEYQYLSSGGEYLICVSAKSAIPGNGRRVSIHPRLSLLCEGESYCGFLLEQPVQSLVRFDGSFTQGDVAGDVQFLVEPLRDYLAVAEERNWHLLEAADPGVRETLRCILRKLSPYPEDIEPVYALRERCRTLLQDYFAE
ncbi:hypothetical protein OOT46_15945 [Aquabacterium sp. A7-Y]|uniref:hypothetical protein n=1 Tax=Aquabacterium sp. A7-Y TaxID=1349605 RepID=UPI00223C976B|nr:hypothetical protein [Aquabacterium sp. A7-Y]MCW7539337.1 hypothetical protein [Aquabacterium sp. A7-Y]